MIGQDAMTSLRPTSAAIPETSPDTLLSQGNDRLLQVVLQISQTLDMETILSTLARELRQMEGVAGSMVSLHHEAVHAMKIEFIDLPAEMEMTRRNYLGYHVPVEGNSIEAVCFRNQKPVRLKKVDAKSFDTLTRAEFDFLDVNEILSVPLINPHFMEIPLGVLTLFLSEPDNIALEAGAHPLNHTLELFVRPLCNAFQYHTLKQMETVLQKASNERKEYLRFIERITNLDSENQILTQIAEALVKWFDFDVLMISLKTEDVLLCKEAFTPHPELDEVCRIWKALSLEDPYPLKMKAGLIAIAFITNKVMFVEDVEQFRHLPMSSRDRKMLALRSDLKSVLHIPIRKESRPIGVVTAVSFDRTIQLGEEQMELIELICSFVGSAIVNANLFSTVEAQKEEMERRAVELRDTQNKLLITERKRLQAMQMAKEAAEASAQAKGLFLANMSHEIRTPMNAIIGLTHLAMKADLDEQTRSYLNKISNSSQSLLSIINDILDFSKIESGNMELEQIDFSLVDLLDRIVDMFSGSVSEKGVDLYIEPLVGVPEHLNGDPHRLGQVFINLINNAFKFTEEGQIDVSLSLQERDENQVRLNIKIQDSGIGIEADKLDKLFHSFTQADLSTTRKYGGTGLGLAISKRIVELMGGSIRIESEKGKGTCFSFDIVLGLSAEKVLPFFRERSELVNKSVLIVSENVSLLQYLSALMKSFGMRPAVAQGYEEAVRLLLTQVAPGAAKFELLIVSEKIMEMDAIAFVKRIRMHPDTAHIPAMMVAPMVRMVDLNAQGIGVINAMVARPVKARDILNRLSKMMRRENASEWFERPEETMGDQVRQQLSGARILLAEDNPINQEVAVALLQQVGLIVDIANNGDELLRQLDSSQKYDLVLTDLQMPLMGGDEATRQIRQDHRFNDLPIIAMTAHAMGAERERCLALGMNDYLTKPIDVDQLYAALIQWIPPRTQLDGSSSNTVMKKGYGQSGSVLKEEVRAKTDQGVPDSLPGMEVRRALRQLGGNQKLFIKVVKDFRDQYTEIVDTLQANLTRGDIASAQMVVHTLKGLAGTLAASELQESATELNTLLKQGDKKRSLDRLMDFSQKLDVVLNSIARLLPQTDSVGESEIQKMSSLDQDFKEKVIFPLLDEIETHLNQNSYGSRKLLEELQELLVGQDANRFLHPVMDAVGRFDFNLALQFFQELSRRFHEAD
jgi:signal transduction histidine kinase/DNA-binding response OmpR family regulator/HPt (histidine-containing phosphotransfer) domain-containing protein